MDTPVAIELPEQPETADVTGYMPVTGLRTTPYGLTGILPPHAVREFILRKSISREEVRPVDPLRQLRFFRCF